MISQSNQSNSRSKTDGVGSSHRVRNITVTRPDPRKRKRPDGLKTDDEHCPFAVTGGYDPVAAASYVATVCRLQFGEYSKTFIASMQVYQRIKEFYR